MRFPRKWICLLPLYRLPAIVGALCVLATTSLAQGQARVEVRPVDIGQDVLLVIDGNLVQAESIAISPRVQQVVVWLRDLERLGWGVIESADSSRVVFKARNVTLRFTKGQSIAMLNSLSVELPIAVYLDNGRLMVPLSFVAKSLGYTYSTATKLVASVETGARPQEPIEGSILGGEVTYNGRGARGIKVRLVYEDFRAVPGTRFTTLTDGDGRFAFIGVPEGQYRAQVAAEDNPGYFVRTSNALNASGGNAQEFRPIALERILTPIKPKPGSAVQLSSRGLDISWTQCPEAHSYKLLLRKRDTEPVLFSTNADRASATVPASKLLHGVTYSVEVTAVTPSGAFLGGTSGAGGTAWTFTVSSPR